MEGANRNMSRAYQGCSFSAVLLIAGSACAQVDESAERHSVISSNQALTIEQPALDPSEAHPGIEAQAGTAEVLKAIKGNQASPRTLPPYTSGAVPLVKQDGASSYLSGLGALAVVLVVIGGLYWAARRWTAAGRKPDSSIIDVVARSAIGPKQSLVLVRLARRFVLIGISGEHVATLSEITDAQEVDELMAQTHSVNAARGEEFKALLKEQALQYKAETGGEPVPSQPAGRQHGEQGPVGALLSKLRGLQQT